MLSLFQLHVESQFDRLKLINRKQGLLRQGQRQKEKSQTPFESLRLRSSACPEVWLTKLVRDGILYLEATKVL